MDHLLENYKTECSRLDLPEGLRELMSDISREVLRAQPPDICRFIANYLSALMVTRDDLAVASQLCNYVCECECHPELLSELMDLGLDSANAEIAQDVIMKYFKNENVNEANILAGLLAKTTIEASMYPDIVNAVRAAYARHQAHTDPIYKKPPEGKLDEVAAAASHTLELYRRARPTDGLCEEMATKIQASYRAYGVRRGSATKTVQPKDSKPVIRKPEPEVAEVTSHKTSISEDIRDAIELTSSLQQKRVNTASSISLAGSLCAMPQNRPYTAQDIGCLIFLQETEKENGTIDYTTKTPNVSEVSIGSNRISRISDKRISFRNVSQEELFYDQTFYDDHVEDAIPQEVEEEHYHDVIWTEHSEATYFEDVTEMDEFDDGEFQKDHVNDDDIEYINNMNMNVDSDSGEDHDTQKIH